MVTACMHVLSSIQPSIHHHHHHHQIVRYYKNDNRPFKWLWEIIASMEEKRPSEEEDEEAVAAAAKEEEEDAKGWSDRRWRGRGGCGGGVTLEGFVFGAAGNGEGGKGKTRRSLTDEDLEELKGCLDLGFGFSYEEIPELRNTLPALELCYSMSQMLRLDDPNHQMSSEDSLLLADWRISSPGDDPDEVKARLKYWAQTVACTLRLCS